MHPDGTISPEVGICLNPYVSRLGVGLLSSHDASARALAGLFQGDSIGPGGVRPYLGDDLRLSRWSYLPLVTALMSDSFQPAPGGARALGHALPQGWTHYKSAAVCAYHSPEWHLYFSPAGGGTVRIYRANRLVGEDLGVSLDIGGERFASSGYDSGRRVVARGHGFAVSSQLGAVRFFQPSFLQRLILRVGSSSALGSRILRALIDRRRIKQRTAANQSAAPVAGRRSAYTFERFVEVLGDRVRIVDRIESEAHPIDPARVMSLLTVAGETQTAPSGRVPSRLLMFTKTFDLSDAREPGFAWQVDHAPVAGVAHERT
jgi:hypothetical protein